MTARTVCPAVYAGLIGGALVATPQSAYALNLQKMTQQSLTGNHLTDGVLWVGAGIVVGATIGLCIHGCKSAYQYHVEKAQAQKVAVAAEESTVAQAQHKPRHMKQVAPAVSDIHEHVEHVAKHSNKDVDLEKVADNYVKKEQYKHKKSVRSQGVAYVLAQRLGLTANMMEGIPVIERADGTVGDVGTTWWEAAVEDKQVAQDGINNFFHIDDNWSATSMLDNPEAPINPLRDSIPEVMPAVVEAKEPVIELEQDEYGLPHVRVMVDSPSIEPMSIEDTSEHSIEYKAYLEDSALEGVSKEDIWKMALEAMDENIANDVVSHKIELENDDQDINMDIDIEEPIDFEDVIGYEDSLDDPDGLEPKTDFIPFIAPVGHPEVVDTDSYIEYLIRTEEERINSRRVSTKSRKHLRVIEGGTSQFSVIDENYLGRAKQA